jgi:RNA recognition motif-containing protein
LKKKDRKKVVKLITEKIKKKIKEKYKYCNLFIKNIPDNLEESDLMTLLSKYGKIRSFRLVLNEKSFSQFLQIKIPHNKRYAFVCYEDELCASKCKMELHNKVISSGINRLYVNFHQSKNERADFLKMVFLNQSKNFLTNNCSINDQITQAYNPRYNQPDLSPYQMNILKIGSRTRKLPHENFPAFYKGFVRVSNPSNDNLRDTYGERLYKKINSNLKFESYSRFFNKIIGIFLELDEDCLKRLIDDTVYFEMQVEETIKMLIEKESKTEN